MEVNLICKDQKYNMHYTEYMVLWKSEGERIIDAIETSLGLKFIESKITIEIGQGYQDKGNFSGNSINENMVFRYNNRCKIGTFFHELSHRIIMEHDLYNKVKEKYNLRDEHQLIDLFLYDAIEKMYGEKAALYRVDYEKAFPEKEFAESWEYALKLKKNERKNILCEMIENEL